MTRNLGCFAVWFLMATSALGEPQPPDDSWLTQTGTLTGVLSDLAGIAAIIVGGYWTYRRFIQSREAEISAEIKQKVIANLALGEGRRYVKILVQCTNIGGTALYPWWTHSSAQQILPLSGIWKSTPPTSLNVDESGEIPWETIARHDESFRDEAFVIEPKEHHRWTFDFIIDADITAIALHTMVYCSEQSPVGSELPVLPNASSPERTAGLEKAEILLEKLEYWEDTSVITFKTTKRKVQSSK